MLAQGPVVNTLVSAQQRIDGTSEWTFTGTDKDGNLTEVRGVDLFEIENGLISRKDTYRKNRISPSI